MKTKIMLLMLLFLSGEIKAWDTTAAKFYPLSTGNVFVYQYSELRLECWICCSQKFKHRVTGDTAMPNGKKYFTIKFFTGSGNVDSTFYERIDSSSMNVYSYINGEEVLQDSLMGKHNDWFNGKRNRIGPSIGAHISNSSQFVFNQNRYAKAIFNGSGPYNAPYFYYLTEGIGLTEIYYCMDWGANIKILGCYVDGVVYGDTTLTGINQIGSSVPEKFVLFQNYPNPFNPVTNLEFGISDLGFVSLKVYDMLGKEITTLVYEKLSPGNYKVEFDGSGLPSGVYFYKIETGDFVDVKRMVLIK